MDSLSQMLCLCARVCVWQLHKNRVCKTALFVVAVYGGKPPTLPIPPSPSAPRSVTSLFVFFGGRVAEFPAQVWIYMLEVRVSKHRVANHLSYSPRLPSSGYRGIKFSASSRSSDTSSMCSSSGTIARQFSMRAKISSLKSM